MKPLGNDSRRRNAAALTLIEVLVIVALLWILAALFLPLLAGSRKSPRIKCVSNLKQIGLAYRIWAEDHYGKYPMEVSVTNGGTQEFVESRTVFLTYQVMSNALSDPRLLYCPSDLQRRAATNFSSDFKIEHISYFIGVNASASNSTMFLAGDRNLTSRYSNPRGTLILTTNQPADWTEAIHNNHGNILLADGNVRFSRNSYSPNSNQQTVPQLLQASSVPTNRLAIP